MIYVAPPTPGGVTRKTETEAAKANWSFLCRPGLSAFHGHVEVTEENLVALPGQGNLMQQVLGQGLLTIPSVNGVDCHLTKGEEAEGDGRVAAMEGVILRRDLVVHNC
jgi:hypothetical protein